MTDDEQLPQTDQVFDAPALVMNSHEWLQQGYYLLDNCNPKKPDCHPGGIGIPYGKMLTKDDKGEYQLIDE